MVQEVLARHHDVEVLLEAEVDVDEIQRLHAEVFDEGAIGRHLLFGDLQRVANGGLHRSMNRGLADQWLGHSPLVDLLSMRRSLMSGTGRRVQKLVGKSVVDNEVLAPNAPRGVRTEKEHHSGHVLQLDERRRGQSFHTGPVLTQHDQRVRLEQADRDAVHGDLTIPELGRPLFHEAFHGRLHATKRVAGQREAAAETGDEHDVTRAPLHQRQSLLHTVDISEVVGLDELEKVALEKLAGLLEGSARRVEHEDVQATELSADLLEHGGDSILLPDISLDGHRTGSALHELLGKGSSLGLRAATGLAIVDDQVRAGIAQLPCNDSTQSTRATGDQGHTAATGSHSMSLVPNGSGQRALRPGWMERRPELMAGRERWQAEELTSG